MKKSLALRIPLMVFLLFSSHAVFCQSLNFQDITTYLKLDVYQSVYFFMDQGFTEKKMTPSGRRMIYTLYKGLHSQYPESLCLTTINKTDGTEHSAIIYSMSRMDQMLNLMKQMPTDMDQIYSKPGYPVSNYSYETSDFILDITISSDMEGENVIMLVSKINR